MLERLSEVHKVISSSQRAFTMEGGKSKATRFHIKAKVPDTLSLLWLQYSLALCGSPLFKKLLECGLVNWNYHILFTYIYFSPSFVKVRYKNVYHSNLKARISSSLQVQTLIQSPTKKNLASPH